MRLICPHRTVCILASPSFFPGVKHSAPSAQRESSACEASRIKYRLKWGPTHFIWLRRNTVFYGENLKSCSRRSIFAKMQKMTVARSGLGSDSPPGCHSLPSPFDSRFQYLLKREGTKGALSFQQMTGIEPALSAWEAEVLPLNHICVSLYIIYHPERFFNK